MISRGMISRVPRSRRLGDVVEFLDNMRRPVTESERRAGQYPYYGANGLQGTIDDFIFDEPLVLLAEDGGHFGAPDRTIAYRISGKTWVNNHAHVLRPKPEMDLSYLCRVLENYDVTPWVTGTTRGKLTQAGAADILVPVPPLPEQRRIADILDKADALRAKRRVAIAQLDTLTQSIFLDMFGEPATNPKGFPRKQLAALVREGDTINYGVVQPGDEFEEGIPLIRVGDLQDGRVNTTALKRIAPAIEASYSRSRLHGDEILISCVGSTGVIALADESLRRFNIARAVARVRLAVAFDRVYVASYLKSDSIQRYFNAELRTVSQPTLNIKQIAETEVVIPPVAMQREFSRKVAVVERQRSMQHVSLAGNDSLFASVKHWAFVGGS